METVAITLLVVGGLLMLLAFVLVALLISKQDCFGKREKYRDSQDEMTVVYRLEPLDENEAAFLPQDLPEVVLDASHMTTDARIYSAENSSSLANGRIKPSNYSESTYVPEIHIMPMGPTKKKATSTLNRTASLESIHMLQQRKYKRPMTPNYIPVNTQNRYGSELGVSTYSHLHPAQVRRQYLVPYKPVYIKPQAYHHSLPRPHNTRVYRQPSNAESYTLSRPPGRAQPIRIVQQPPITTRTIEDVSATHLMQQEQYRNTYSRPQSQPQPQTTDFRNGYEKELVIEAALEPPKNSPPLISPPRYSSSTRTHVKDIQYHPSDQVTSTSRSGGVEISPVPPEGGAQESEEWQEVSLYVRRPSLEDVRRAHPQMADNTNNNTNRMRSNVVETRRTTTHSNLRSHTMETSSRPRMRSHGQRITTNPTSYSPTSAGQNQSYVYRTTIPRDPQPRQKSVPMIMVNDEAMQF